MARKKLLDPIKPGEILLEDFMKPLKISINQLSRDLAVPPNRISEIVNGKRVIQIAPVAGAFTRVKTHPATDSRQGIFL